MSALLALSVLSVLTLFSQPAHSEDKPAPRTPDRTELWVPSEELARVLEKPENKNAVLLTPEQYAALIRDAGKLKSEDTATPPPTGAVVESIRLKGRVLDGESGVRLSGEITAKALAKGWSAASVKLPWKSVGKLSTGGDALLTLPSQTRDTKSPLPVTPTLSLFVKGPAQHRVEFECAAAINHGGSPDERVLFFEPTAIPTVLELTLPAGAQITQGPSHETAGDVHHFILNSSASGTSIIAWRLQPPAGSLARVSTQSLRGVCRVAESELTATYDLLLSSTATDAPAKEIAFDVSPASASVISVEGDKVESWVQTGSALVVKLSGEARAPQLRVELRSPLALPEKDTLPVELAALVLAGAKQVPAIVEMSLDEGVEMLELRSSRSLVASVAEWDAAVGTATAVIRKVTPRIVVDADARAFVSRDFAEIERFVNATTDVPVDHLKVNLPAGEELLEVNWQSGPKLEWKRVGQTIEIEWQQRVDARTPGKFTIKSRKKLPADAQAVTIINITIDEAKKLAGYIALDHDSAWRVALKQTSGLEDRDARLTPVSGKMAWFALREFTLGFELQRRDSVVDAEITAYALPRAKSVEIDGQIALDITGAPLRQIEVRVTKEQAKLLRFTSPLIAEQTLDEATGAWKLTLARESTGRVALRFRLSLPGKPDAAGGTATTLVATLPHFEIPVARRFHGSWVVEANTDTQLSFATQSLQPVDVMRVPAVEDYTPRHRLVAAFAYGSGAHELTVTATRHTSSELAALVVSKLALTSVLSVDGSSKHEAVIDLRHSGEQFAHVRLPSGAQLLSVIVDGRAVKPVRGENETIAIPLPGGTAVRDTVSARLIYELPGDPWSAHGSRKLEPLTILGNAPILATDWQIHVPDGFSYDKVATGLEQSGTFEPEGILGKLADCIAPFSTFAFARRSVGSKPADEMLLPRSPTAHKKRSVEQLAGREITRRTASLEDARRDLDQGDKYYADSRLEDAFASYRAALEALPDSPSSKDWRDLGEAKFADSAVALARERAKEGKYEESLRLIDSALAVRPQHKNAATFKRQLQDPDRVPRTLTPPATTQQLEKAKSKADLGDLDKSSQEYQDVLRRDPYNKAARRGMERVEELKSEYFDTARDRTRAQMLAKVDEKWEEKVPVASNADPFAAALQPNSYQKEKMDRIILPVVSFKDATVEEAIEFLRVKSRDLDTFEKAVENRGLNMVLRTGDAPVNARITLDLKDVPMTEALRYVTELAGMKYKIEPKAVMIVPISETSSEQYTRVYHLPQGFDQALRDAGSQSAVEILRRQGIQFPEGASATIEPQTSRLVVKNTQPNLDLVETFVQSILALKPEELPHALYFESGGGVSSEKVGLIPLELDLTTSGQLLQFSGTQAPEVLELRFTSWERQMAWACGLMAAGGLVFALWGRRRAVLRTLLVLLVLSLGVKLLSEERLPLANAALFGWLVALGIWMVFRVCVGISKRTGGVSHVEALPMIISFASIVGGVAAEETKVAPDLAAHTVVVPYDVKKPLNAQKPLRYYMDRASFERLWSLAKDNRKPEKPDDAGEKAAATIHSAAYRAVVEDERLIVEAKFEIGTRGAWTVTAVPVKSGDSTAAVVRDWTLDGKPTAVVDGAIQIEKPGVHVVQAVIELNRKPGWKEAHLTLPPSLASFVSLSVPSSDGRPKLEGVDLLTEEQSAGQRVFTAVLGEPGKLKLTRRPRRPLADATPPASAETELIIGHTSGGAQSLLGSVRFDFPGTERTRFSLAVDADWQIAGWEARQNGGEIAVRHWAVRDVNGRRVIDFELDRPVADTASVSIRGTRSGGTGSLRTPVLEPQATKGQQTIALLHDETLKLVPQPTTDQRRIDKPATTNAAMSGGRGQTTALFFKTPAKQTLAYNVVAASAKQQAHTDYVFQLSEQKQEMMAAVTLKSVRDAWSQLRIALPAEFEIQSVDGPALASWKQEKNDLFLQFNPATGGVDARLLIYLARSVAQQQTTWTIEPLGFTGFEKVDGSALIVAHAATEARLVDFKTSAELQEADPTKAADVFAIMPPQEKKRAIKFERGDWKVNVSLARQPVRFSSDGVVLAQATDVGLLVSQQVAFYVEQGALSRVTVKLPAALPEATVKGDALREVQTRVVGAVREYECSFQSDVLSRAALTFDMELPLAGELSLPFVDVTGAERLRRFFVLDNSSSRESKTVEATGVENCAKNALPYVPDVLSQPSFYRGKSGTGVLKVAYEQLQSTEGNAAIVTLADITTAWRADGERWDTVVYSVFNRSLQFLPLILPERAELISVAVSGEAVRADQETAKDGRVVRLVPLIQTRGGQRSLEVKLIYRMKEAAHAPLEKGRALRMDDPELVGISAERTVWTAVVPKQFSIRDIDGNMEEVAEESKVVERLQGLMSDFSRLNKVLSSRGSNLSKEEGEYAIKEAEKLEKVIEQESRKVADSRQRKSEFYYKEARKQDDEAKIRLQTERAGKDLGDLQKELGKQKQMLSENRVASPKFGKKGSQALSLENTWNFNNDAAPKGKEQADFANSANPLLPQVNEPAGSQANIALNDNTVVQNGFLNQGALVISGVISGGGVSGAGTVALQAGGAGDDKRERAGAGVISGTGGVTVTKAGSGTMVLSGSNTYTGATTVDAGTLIVSNAGATGTGSLALNGGTAFGGALTIAGVVNVNGHATAGNEMTVQSPLPNVQLAQGIPSQMQGSLITSGSSQITGNARANVVSQSQMQVQSELKPSVGSAVGGGFGASAARKSDADSIDGLIRKPELLRAEDRAAMALTPPPAPAAPMPAAASAAPGQSAADPFGAEPMPAEKANVVAEVVGRAMTRSVGGQVGFDAPQIPQSFGLEAQVASQLRATGRRSLMIDVPSDGTAYHFRKLKDHAVLELKLRKAWTSEQRSTAIWLGVGLGVWLLLSIIAQRRRAAQPRP